MKHTDYEKAKALGLTDLEHSDDQLPRHPMSERLMEFLVKYDYNNYSDYFQWKTGGDGDNGEMLMDQMDAFFEYLDKEKL